MKKVFIRGSVPTSYQYNSLKKLGTVTGNPGGSFSLEIEFDTVEQAKEYLRERLQRIMEDTNMTDEEYNEAKEGVENGSLSYDAATIRIEEDED